MGEEEHILLGQLLGSSNNTNTKSKVSGFRIVTTGLLFLIKYGIKFIMYKSALIATLPLKHDSSAQNLACHHRFCIKYDPQV